MEHIITLRHFEETVYNIVDGYVDNEPPLEEYLQSLWLVIKKYKNTKVSLSLLAEIIEETFLVKSPKFDKRWLVYNRPLTWNYIETEHPIQPNTPSGVFSLYSLWRNHLLRSFQRDGQYVIEEVKNGKINIVKKKVSDFEILKHTILFQIADLHRMGDVQQSNKFWYYGVTSATGNRWYNLNLYSYWTNGIRGMIDHRGKNSEMTPMDWADVAAFLELGRLYE
jgi:hypothetical protein